MEYTNSELADLINAHLQGGNTRFQDRNLGEFTLIEHTDPRLEEFRQRVLAIEVACDQGQENGLYTSEGKQALIELECEYRRIK